MASNYLVTGANRGLGLEFVRQLAQAGHTAIATARAPQAAHELQEAQALGAPGKIRIEALDVTSDDSAARLRERLGNTPIDTLINNAAIGGDRRSLFEQDFDNHRHCFEVNSIGPLRVTLALIDRLRAGTERRVVNITSQLGSMTLNTSGGYHPYRASKAALNMVSRTLAAELGREGFTCVMLHPGWVRTDMGGPAAPLSPRESVRGMLRVLLRLSAEHNGKFYDYSGREMPW